MSAGNIELSPPSRGHISQWFAQKQGQDGQPHAGQDWAYTDGVNIFDGAYAMADGVVVWADDTRKLGWPNPWYFNPDFDRTDRQDSSAGNAVVLKHWFGYTTYCHLEETPLNIGDPVKRGQRVGTVGASGFSFGKHLHSDLILNGADVSVAPLYGRSDPNPYLTGTLSFSGTITQEDDMPWNETFDKDVRGSLQNITNEVRGLSDLNIDVRGDLANKGKQLAALTAATNQLATLLAEKQGLDVEAVRAAVASAIADGITLTVKAGV